MKDGYKKIEGVIFKRSSLPRTNDPEEPDFPCSNCIFKESKPIEPCYFRYIDDSMDLTLLDLCIRANGVYTDSMSGKSASNEEYFWKPVIKYVD